RRRLGAHPPAFDAEGCARAAGHRRGRGGGQVRLPARRAQVRRAAARRHRVRHRPDGGAAGGHGLDPRCDRVPQDHRRTVPDDRCPFAGRRGAAEGAARVGAQAGVTGAMTLAIRRATVADAKTLSRLARRTFDETFGHLYPAEDLQAFFDDAYAVEKQRVILAHPDYAVWFLEDGGEAVGHAAAGPCGLPHPEVAPDDGELKRLYLLKEYQRGCWGGRMVDTAMAW